MVYTVRSLGLSGRMQSLFGEFLFYPWIYAFILVGRLNTNSTSCTVYHFVPINPFMVNYTSLCKKITSNEGSSIQLMARNHSLLASHYLAHSSPAYNAGCPLLASSINVYSMNVGWVWLGVVPLLTENL